MALPIFERIASGAILKLPPNWIIALVELLASRIHNQLRVTGTTYSYVSQHVKRSSDKCLGF